MAEMADTSRGELSGASARNKIRELLPQFKSAMLITAGDAGVHTRPMGLLGQAGDFHGTLWFITDDRSRKVADLAASAHAAVAFQNDDAGVYLHLDGRAAQSHDRARLAQVYTPIQRTWFPAGLDDPHMTLIRFEVDRGEFWDARAGTLGVLVAFAKAVGTGTPGDAGDSGHLKLQ
jgi:general stress protein 26